MGSPGMAKGPVRIITGVSEFGKLKKVTLIRMTRANVKKKFERKNQLLVFFVIIWSDELDKIDYAEITHIR